MACTRLKADSEKVRLIILNKGLTRRALAKAAHVSTATLNAMVQGNRTLNSATFYKVAQALGVEPATLLKTETTQ